MELVWVGIGGALGAIARYTLGKGITERVHSLFPFGTFTVNLLGAFLIGVLFAVLTERGVGHPHLKLLLVTGFLGGFTTFSSYTLEVINLAESGPWGIGLLYVIGSNVLGLLACAGGIAVVRVVW